MFTRYVHRILLIALVLTGAGASYVRAQSGNCGDRILPENGRIASDSANVTWTLYSDSLAFVGIGAMGTTQSGANSQANYIKKAFFSKDITFIGRYALSYMNKLEKITVDPENANYASPDNCNCLIERANAQDTNILLAIGNGYIPEGVEVLRNYALCDNYRLNSITIPRSVKQMGEKTPHQDVGYNESPIRLPSLTEIHVQWTTEEELPEWLADKFILNASNITLYVPCGTKSIYQNAAPWNTCKKIVDGSGTCGSNLTWSICDSVLTISGTGTMTNWSNSSSVPWYGYRNEIKHVVIEEGVTTIGNYAFYQMSNIKTVTNPSTLKIIGTFAFHSCYGLESINLPNGLTDIGRNTTGHGPFYGCHSLKNLYIPASVTMINKDAFLRCHSLTSIIVDPANTKYDSRNNCNAIIETATNKLLYGCSISVIPDGVVTVSDFAFEYQHNLKSIRISNTVTSFGTMVFKECENLKDIYVEWTENIPNYQLTAWQEHSKANIGIDLDTTITVHVPCGCAGLYQSLSNWKKYKIVDDHKKGGICGANGSNLTWMLDCSDVLTISGTGEMADWGSASDVPWYAYRNAIKTVVIEDGVTTIGGYAFYFCKKLSSITIPNSVTIIGNNAFQACQNLLSLTIPSSVASIGSSALSSFTADLYVSWTGTDILTYTDQVYPSTTDITLHIPCGTTQDYTDKNWSTRCTISDDVPQILSGTCGPDGHESDVTWSLNLCDSTLTFSGTGPMHWRTDSYEDFGWHSYNNRTAVKKVIFGSGITFIGIHTLSQFFNLEYIEVEAGNPVYDSRENCNALVHTATNTIVFGAGKTVIPSSVRALRAWAFSDMHKLTSITIPATVESVGNEPFTSDDGVDYHYTNVTKGYAFKGCINLTDIYVEWTSDSAIPNWISVSNKSPQASITLHVPCGTESIYAAKTGWKDYTIDGGGSYTVTVQTATGDTSMGTVSIVVN